MYLVFFCFPYFIWLFISWAGSEEKSFSMRTDRSLLASIILKIKKDNQKGKKEEDSLIACRIGAIQFIFAIRSLIEEKKSSFQHRCIHKTTLYNLRFFR